MGSRVSVFDEQLQKVTDLLSRARSVFESAGVEYRVVGGLAVLLHAENAHPDAGRLTRDIDVAIRRADLPPVASAAPEFGLQFRSDALTDLTGGGREVHFVFVGEKVRPEYVEPVPNFSTPVILRGTLVAPVADLVRMKLTSFRLKDQVHIQGLDELGLVTPDVEAGLSPFLRERLAHVRATP